MDEQLQVTLSSETARIVEEHIAAGHYASPSELVNAAIHVLEAKETRRQAVLAEVRAKIQAAIDDPSPRLSSEEMWDHMTSYMESRRPRVDQAG